MACNLSNKHLTRLFTNLVMSRRKGLDISSSTGKKVFLSDSFQEMMSLKLFGLSVSSKITRF